MKRFLYRICTVCALIGIVLSMGQLPVEAQAADRDEMTSDLRLEVSSIPLLANVTDLSYLTYYYSQLGEDSKQIYDSLADPSSLERLKLGEWVTAGETYEIVIPPTPTQEQYDACIDRLDESRSILGARIDHVTDAIAALDRDRSDLFWTSGVRAKVGILEDGVPLEGAFPVGFGNTYTVYLAVQLPLCEEWDRDGVGDRNLTEDIELLNRNLSQLIAGAKGAAGHRYGQLQYINRQLTKYNAYNHSAAAGELESGYHIPWTALSALDQLATADDGAPGSAMPVCEGYARALKLICDGLGIPSVLVSGTGDGEPHIWNYVQMEDGIWYAVDVTWNDSMGEDRYFLVGADVMAEKHVSSPQIMGSEQTVAFTYPALSATAYEFVNPHEFNVERLEDLTLTYGSSATLSQVICTTGGILEWSTTDPEVAFVDAQGSLVITGAGSARLTVTAKATAEYSASSISFALTVHPKELTLTGLSALDRAYDGTVEVSLSGGALQGILAGDEVRAVIPATGQIPSPNASESLYTVQLPTLTLTGADASNYILKQPEPITVRISKAIVTVTVIDQTVKVGDGFPDDPVLSPNVHYTVTGLVGNDHLTRIGLEYKNNEQILYSFKTPGIFDIIVKIAEAGDNYEVRTVDGKITVLQHEHPYGSWSRVNGEKHARICTYCQYEETAPHRYGDWQTVKEAKVGVVGERKRICQDCGYEVTDAIPALEAEKTTHQTTAQGTEPSEPSLEFDLASLIQEPVVLLGAGGVVLILLIGIIVAIIKKNR